MPYQPTLATLGYILSGDRRRALLVHRNRNPDDQHRGKYNGVGGKLEPGEDVVACIRREVMEEVGVECVSLRLRGTVSWPGFGKNGEAWFGFLFVIDAVAGEPFTSNAEGDLEWVDLETIYDLPMWEGDRHFLPLVFGDSPQFHGVMPYENGRPVSWSYSLME